MIFKIFDYADQDLTGGDLGYLAKCISFDQTRDFILIFPVGMYGARLIDSGDMNYPIQLIHVPFKAIQCNSEKAISVSDEV